MVDGNNRNSINHGYYFCNLYGICRCDKSTWKKGMDAFTRIMGLLTVSIAVQFALTGFAEWFVTL